MLSGVTGIKKYFQVGEIEGTMKALRRFKIIAA